MTAIHERVVISVKYYSIITEKFKDVLRFFVKAFKITSGLTLFALVCYFIGCFCDNRVPFTKWCGLGELATHPEDFGIFGYFIAVDKCCKGHDSCPHYIRVNETRFQLKNPIPYTISHCSCDDSFRMCLKRTIGEAEYLDKILAFFVKFYYFNMIKMPCFQINTRRLNNVKSDPFKTNDEEKIAIMRPGRVFDIIAWLVETT